MLEKIMEFTYTEKLVLVLLCGETHLWTTVRIWVVHSVMALHPLGSISFIRVCSSGCDLRVCCLKNQTKSKTNTGFILPTCPICCLVQSLQCPIPLFVPAPLLALLLLLS